MTVLHIHGGRIDLAAARYPDAPHPWLDLSTGINPIAWKPVGPLAGDPERLPSPSMLLDLETAAAAVFGTDPDRVMALPGSELGLRSLPILDLRGPARFVAPSYGTHAEAIPGATAIATTAIDKVIDGTLVLANPNNPDGRSHDPHRLLAIAQRGVWLVVDEAFADVVPGASIVPHLAREDRVIVFRSFGKVFGLPGLRLGFMIAPPAQLAVMRRRLGSWPVSSQAIAYGLAAYRDADWLDHARTSIVERANRLDAMLARHGLRATGDCPLFRLVEGDAPKLYDRLARAGILTRPFDYAPRWLRLGVPAGDDDFERLDDALAHG